MDVTEFSNILHNLLKKINQEQKTVFLLGDFNIDLMHYNDHKPANEFSYLPNIIQPSRHTSYSRTLIDNIFSNVILKDIISGNIAATISDHLPQFLISPNTFADSPSNKSNAFGRDWSHFDQGSFVLDYVDINWPNILKHDEKNVNSATNNFLDTINSALNKHAQLKKVNKYKLRFKNKPWITSGIQKSIYIENKLLKKFINKKDPQTKVTFYEQYKTYRNLLSTLMKQRKQTYYTKYF